MFIFYLCIDFNSLRYIEMKANLEVIATGVALIATTAIATKFVKIPYVIASSPYTAGILVILALLAFSYSPALGVVLFVLTAVVLFQRNVLTASMPSYTNNTASTENTVRSYTTAQSMYGDESIAAQPQKNAYPYSTQSSEPRSYDQFQETDKSNPALGPIQEGFEPAPYGDEQGSPVDGSYPIEEQRASSSPDTRTYMYRPEPDTGSNTFSRFGPDIDEKRTSFKY